MALVHDKVLQMRVSEEWLATIDDWRAAQRPVPSRAEAIRRLVDFALSSEPLVELISLAPPGKEIGEWAQEMLAQAQEAKKSDDLDEWIASYKANR